MTYKKNSLVCRECMKIKEKEVYRKKRLDPNYVEKERKRSREKWRKNKLLPRELHWDVNRPKTDFKKEWERKNMYKKRVGLRASRKLPNKEGYQKHHWSYRDEHSLDILYLTVKEHKKAHRFLLYDESELMYRRFDTNELLDTKEEHEKFIRMCIEKYED